MTVHPAAQDVCLARQAEWRTYAGTLVRGEARPKVSRAPSQGVSRSGLEDLDTQAFRSSLLPGPPRSSVSRFPGPTRFQVRGH